MEEPAAGDGVCASCAREDDELVAVRRVYLVPDAADTRAWSTTLDEVELWCFSCRSMYPHEPVPEDASDDESEEPDEGRNDDRHGDPRA